MRRFSIGTLVAVIVISAISFAGLRNADDTWARMMTILALTNISMGVVWARTLRGRERAWWFGLGAVGSTYLVVSFSPLTHRLYTTDLLDFVHDKVVASTVLHYTSWSDRDTVCFMVVYDDGAVRIIEVPASVVNSISTDDLHASFEPVLNRWRFALPGARDRSSFRRVGHSLFSMLAGLIGATAFSWIFRRRECVFAARMKQRLRAIRFGRFFGVRSEWR
jgi:hypothetical protein